MGLGLALSRKDLSFQMSSETSTEEGTELRAPQVFVD